MSKKIAVVGAGMAGLASAARLARAGFAVEIFESSERVGGKCRTEWFGDYAFDTGPTLLTLPAVFKDLFKKTGRRFEQSISLSPIDPACKYFFPDGTELDFPNLDLQKILLAIDGTLGKRAGNDWHNIMQRAEAMWDLSRTSFIEGEIPPIYKLARRKNLLREMRIIAPWRTLSATAEKYTDNPHLQSVIKRFATYTGSDPRKAPGVLLTIAFMETTFGAWHVDGGIGELAVQLAERCQELGVKIHLQSPVEEILTPSGVATGIKVAGEILTFDAVVANADSDVVYNRLITGERRILRRERKKISRNTKSLSGFSLYLGLNNEGLTDLPQLAEHNVIFPDRYDEEFEDIFTRHIPVQNPAIYICAPRDAKMVKGSNKEAWSVLVNAPRHDPQGGFDWSNAGEEYARKIIALLDQQGLRVSERLAEMHFRTPADMENIFTAPGGSIYGSASHGSFSVFQRAKNRSPIKNLYVVGGSAHPGGGLPMVTISGELVAEAIISSGLGAHLSTGISQNHH